MPELEAVAYSIAAVSKLTGVSCHALRVWERRYGFPVPARSASGHRRYSREQVAVIRRLSELTRAGQPIGDLIADLQAGRLRAEEVRQGGELAHGESDARKLLDHLMIGDVAGADACFARMTERLDGAELIARVIEPILVEAGDRWFRRECSVHQEHLVSAFLRGKLVGLVEQARRLNARPRHTILVGTVQGDRHEGGILILNYILERNGWRVLNACVDQPVSEFCNAVNTWRPDALGVSFVLSRNINKRFRELSRIREVPIFVGGRSILNYQGLARRHGLIPLPGSVALSFPDFQREYDRWREARQASAPAPG